MEMLFSRNTAFKLLNVQEYSFNDDIGIVRERPFYALSLRIEGDTEITIGGKTYHLTDGSLTLFPPNMKYKRVTKSDKLIVFHFTTDNNEIVPFTILKDFCYEKLEGLFSQALELYNQRNQKAFFSATSLFFEVMAELCNDENTTLPKQKAKIEDYFRLNSIKNDFSVSVAAHDLYMSENGLRKAVKRHFGVSPKELCNSMRMEYAKGMLLSGYYSVSTVCEMSGFTDSKNFATAFKKYYGISPSKIGK